MSAIAGIVNFSGQPVAPGEVEAMTAAMVRRGPDGLDHWRKGKVAMGQCMLRTTPESLEETQPLTNEDQSLVLVLDGRVDNWQELRRELLSKGAVLRTRADAELVLRAYEVWGELCPGHIIGEYAFFIWDAPQQCLFAARDAAGTRHFHYHQGKGWFGFASEIKGLLALSRIERRLNESRLLDYLVIEFDRDDEVGTFYQGIMRMPAGHAMSVTAAGTRLWRWWNPGELSEQKFDSMEECTEAFMDRLRVAVKCRLRSVKPVGAMLSGGMDSSAIVGLISKEFRDELQEPLRTFSLILEDRENCPDWRSIEQILDADRWLQPTIVTSAKADEVWQAQLQGIEQADEPFSVSNGFTYGLTYEAGHAAGCGVMFDGMAGDVLFYDLDRTVTALAERRLLGQAMGLFAACRNHGASVPLKDLMKAMVADAAPDPLRAIVRRRRDERQLNEGDMALLRPEIARRYQASKRSVQYLAGDRLRPAGDQMRHAGNFTSGLISFGHEVYGPLALANGIEPRSPFSDRRLIEFAIRMPLAAKLAIPWYKHLLRSGTRGMLPDAVRMRRDIGGHPGWSFHARLARCIAAGEPGFWDGSQCPEPLEKWISPGKLHALRDDYARNGCYDSGLEILRTLILSRWIALREWA